MHYDKFLISALMPVHVHGAICPFVCGVSRVLLPGVRVRDVTNTILGGEKKELESKITEMEI